jgi:hypothetical protein
MALQKVQPKTANAVTRSFQRVAFTPQRTLPAQLSPLSMQS